MPRKCSVGNCTSNYKTSDDKIPVYRFPTNSMELDRWLERLPNIIRKECVTRNMGICRLHWPSYARMKTSYGKEVPDEPPSIFHGCPKTFHRFTTNKTERNVNERRVTSTARVINHDEMDFFEEHDEISNDFDVFRSDLIQRKLENIHIINDESSVHLISFAMCYNEVKFSVSIDQKYSISAYHSKTKVSFHNMRAYLGYQMKLRRWSQLDAVINYVKNYEISEDSEVTACVNYLRQMLQQTGTYDYRYEFLFEQLTLKTKSPENLRYSSFMMIKAMNTFLVSRSAYYFLRTLLTLPHPTTLTKLLGDTFAIGTDSASQTISKLYFANVPNFQRRCLILFDEVYVKPSLKFRCGHIIGYAVD